MKFFLVSLAIVCGLFLPGEAPAQITSPSLPATGPYSGGLSVGTENLFVYADVEIDVKGPKGVPLEGPVVVSLVKLNGQVYYQTTVRNGIARFHNVPKSELTAQVVAPGFQTAKKGFEILDRAEVKVKIDLQPMSDKEEAAADRGIAALTPKTQKEVGKALEALRANRPADAKTHLESAERATPNSAEVEYLLGVYASQLNNQPQALAYWMKTLELNPKHLSALLAVSQGLLQERKASEARPYLSRALDTEPSSWRAHIAGHARRSGETGRACHGTGARASGLCPAASGARVV